uniref:Uncharacterized protein n=1 Tax=Anguilla anguilla TaxID=7936 RepID=A0A0E9QA93_ANGAN
MQIFIQYNLIVFHINLLHYIIHYHFFVLCKKSRFQYSLRVILFLQVSLICLYYTTIS